jgi:site-specific recombinase XerD
MTPALALAHPHADIRQALAVRGQDVLAGVLADKADSTAAVYRQRISAFVAFVSEWEGPDVGRTLMGAWRRHLALEGLSASTINGHLVAAKAFVREAADVGAWPERDAARAVAVRGVVQRGVRLGNWLSADDTRRLLAAPDTRTTRGKRDKALLAVAVVCGLRRSELAALTVGHLQVRKGHNVLADMLGKGGRIRTVVVPAGVYAAIVAWLAAARRQDAPADAPLFVPVNKAGRVVERHMTGQAVADVIRQHSAAIGHQLAAHDTRRCAAQLATDAGASVEYVADMLGHAHQETTRRYLRAADMLDNSATDAIARLLFL